MKKLHILFAIHLAIMIFVMIFVIPTKARAQTVMPSSSLINSNDTVSLMYSYPSKSVNGALYLSCTPSVSMIELNSQSDFCNVWKYWRPISGLGTSTFTAINRSTLTQNVVPNFYVSYPDNPTYWNGVITHIDIRPAVASSNRLRLSIDSASPASSTVSVLDTVNNQYLDLPVLIFDLNSQNSVVRLKNLSVKVSSPIGGSGGSISAAYLYQGSVLLASSGVSNGVANFINIPDNTIGATIPANATMPYSVKVDITGVGGSGFVVQASLDSSGVRAVTTNNLITQVSGSATGNPITVVSRGPIFSLVDSPTFRGVYLYTDYLGNSIYRYDANFNIQILAVGSNVTFGLQNSSFPMFASSTSAAGGIYNSFSVCKNGVIVPTSDLWPYPYFYQPSNTTLSNDGMFFTLSANQSVTIPVNFTFTVKNPGPEVYGVHLNRINWSMNQKASYSDYMANEDNWVAGHCGYGVSVQPSITVLSPNGGEIWKAGTLQTIKWKASNIPSTDTTYVELRSADNNHSSTSWIATVLNPSQGLYYWKIPTSITPGKYIIEVYRADLNGGIYESSGSAKDVSDNYFTISSQSDTVPSCPADYICTPVGSTYTCPSGYTCYPTIYRCPSGYNCVIKKLTPLPTSTPTPSPSSGYNFYQNYVSPISSPTPSPSYLPFSSPTPSPSLSPIYDVYPSQSPSPEPSPSESPVSKLICPIGYICTPIRQTQTSSIWEAIQDYFRSLSD